MDWFLYDNGLRHEMVKEYIRWLILHLNFSEKFQSFVLQTSQNL